MPLYMFLCPACGQATDINLPVERRDVEVTCYECGHLMKRKWGVAGIVIR